MLAKRPSHATVVAYLALFIAIGGTAAALPGRNSVDSGDIRNNEVRGIDVSDNGGAGTLRSVDIADGTITGDDVGNLTLQGRHLQPDTVTGAHVVESSLGQVPSAGTAQNSTNTNGLQVRAFHYAEDAGATTYKVFLSLGGLALAARCETGPNIDLVAQSNTTSNSYVRASNGQTDADFDVPELIDLDAGDNDGTRTLSFRRGAASAGSTNFDANTVSVSLSYDENPASGADCQVAGTALGRP